ncbi:MAG: transposase [Desulfobacteraceae bacterium IS3]|nr:MAG: transposase [Desulfobacteraceae bacterium IS3]HAO19721.1 IS701 family transposase [Desulfobacteraceae bacterium]
MNPPKCNEYDYINFLMAGPKVFSCTEAGKVQPDQENGPAHDSINRLLHRLPANAKALRDEAVQFADLMSGVLIADDPTSDKLYALKIEPVTRHRSGKHHKVVRGINLTTLLWTDGDAHIPCDFRIYHKDQDGKTENDHFADMLCKAHKRGFKPECVLSDSWFAGMKNLRLLRSPEWKRLTRLRCNRSVNPDGKKNIAVLSADISESGTRVHLKGYGFIKVFRIVARNGDIEHRATDDPDMDELRRLQPADFSRTIEEYHRGIRQFCGVGRSQVRIAEAQRNHIGLAIRAFLRFEVVNLKTGYSRFEAEMRIIRDAIRAYLANPVYVLASTA